jgi:hypothetical protein
MANKTGITVGINLVSGFGALMIGRFAHQVEELMQFVMTISVSILALG